MSANILKPIADRRGSAASKASRRIAKKPLIGSLTLVRSDLTDLRRNWLIDTRSARPFADAAAIDIAGADGDVGVVRRHRVDQARQRVFAVLKIAVHHRDHRSGRRQHPFDQLTTARPRRPTR